LEPLKKPDQKLNAYCHSFLGHKFGTAVLFGMTGKFGRLAGISNGQKNFH
jgi:hypothetical protein